MATSNQGASPMAKQLTYTEAFGAWWNPHRGAGAIDAFRSGWIAARGVHELSDGAHGDWLAGAQGLVGACAERRAHETTQRMNKDLELSLLRQSLSACQRSLQQVRQEAHDAWGTTGAQHSLKKIERAAAHTLDYEIRATVNGEEAEPRADAVCEHGDGPTCPKCKALWEAEYGQT